MKTTSDSSKKRNTKKRNTGSGKNSGKSRVRTAPRINPLHCPEKMTAEEWQRALRRQSAEKELLNVVPPDDLLDYFIVKNPVTKRFYNVTFRGAGSRWNYCSCPDFRTNGLGTCKHIEAVAIAAEGKYARKRYPEPEYTAVYIDYRDNRKIKIRIGSFMSDAMRKLSLSLFSPEGEMRDEAYLTANVDAFIESAKEIDERFRWFPDALARISELRDKETRRLIINSKYADSDLSGLLNADLYPYQRDGIKFAFENGRTLIADDMGLGKTIQAIGTAELLNREGYVDSVLIVCPTSLKYQWQSEIKKFTGREALVVEGSLIKRKEQLRTPMPIFKIISYHALANNIKAGFIPDMDMVVFDEIQRLKNWDTRISQLMRMLSSRYVLALSGTPLENKLRELYSVMQLVDQYCLGPYWKFVQETTLSDETGAVYGYKNLNAVSGMLEHVMIRRLKKNVALQMPARTDTNLFVDMTKEQRAWHEELNFKVSLIAEKFRRFKFLSEEDRRRLLLNLSMMRMVCDSTYILDQSSRHDTKIDMALDIINDKLESGDGKIVIFSEWQRMLRILAHELDRKGVNYCFLHGGVPSQKRGEMISRFSEDPECKVFLSTDAGGTGLNLQAANLLVNMDLPWNPAVLEQRVARIYRLGQETPVQIINLVARHTIEEKMLSTLSFKTRMASGILDGGEDSVMQEGKAFKKIMDVLDQEYQSPGGEPSETDETDEPESIEIAGHIVEIEAEDDMGSDETVSVEYTAGIDDDYIEDYADEQYVVETGHNTAGDEDNVNDSDDTRDRTVAPYEETARTDSHERESLMTPDRATSAQSDADDSNRKSKAAENNVRTASEYRDAVASGINALGEIANALKSPETTRQLVDAIVSTDETTGRTTVNIPVPDKETVVNILSVFSSLFNRR